MKLSDGVLPIGGKGVALALGFFDGVHIGHRAVISAAAEYAKANNLDTGVFTFVNGKSKNCLIYDRQTKHEVLSGCGVDICIEPDFSSFQNLAPEAFFNELLIKQFNAKALFCGWNFRFGKNRAGNTDILRELGGKNGLEVQIISQTKLNNKEVSSSIIREILTKGDIKTANNMLCRPYKMKTEILHSGDNNSSSITLKYSHKICGLKEGYYVVNAVIAGNSYMGIVHIGQMDGNYMDSYQDSFCKLSINADINIAGKKTAELEFYEYFSDYTSANEHINA